MHNGERPLFLGMLRLLWAFKFEKATGADGKEIVFDAEDLTEDLFVSPKAFPANIVPRDAERVKTIKDDCKKMKDLLDESLQWRALPEGIIWRKYEQTRSL